MKTLHAMLILAVALISSSCHAAPAPAGSIVTLPVILSTGSQPISAIQFDVDLPVGVSMETIAAGTSATAAQKQFQTNMVNGDLRVIVFGGQAPIPSGPLVQIVFRLAPTMPTGTFQMVLTNASASDPAGISVPLGTNIPGVLSVIANVVPFLKMGSN